MKHLNWKRVAAAAMSLVLAAGTPVLLLTGLIGTKASATSLPYIESIVSGLEGGSKSFHILEIVPQAGTGSIGYYVAGQEPSSGWGQTLGAITKGSPDSGGAYASAAAERTQKMNNEILAGLSAAGLLGTGGTTPLKSTGSYGEVLPWARASGTGYNALQLNHRERDTVSGTFTKKAEGSASSGFDYTQQTTYTIVTGGSYIQNISQFISVSQSTSAADTYFYYSPVFTALNETSADGIADKSTPVYTNTATQADPSATPDSAGYVYYGTLKDGLEFGKKYYYVTSTGEPSVTQGANSYKAKLDATDPYQQVSSNGYFNLTVTGYTYVGDGKGVYSFAPGTGDSCGITYDTVYYTGGYTNNNWFLTKVLDVDAADVSKIRIQVDSLTPAGLSDAVRSQIAADYYDLIVLSNGFLPGGGAIAPYSGSNDLTAGVKTALAAAADSTNKTPVVVDRTLITNTNYAALNIGSLAGSLAGSSSPATFAEGNIYAINSALATNQFDASLIPSSLYNVSGAPFYDVYYEIYHENFLRKTENPNTADLLPETVSMANSIRYIINYRQQRAVTTKTAINVLDIEPASTSSLTAADVLSWLPSGKYTSSDIKITTMSTAEFIGKIDDISETYDMVYVGSHAKYSTDYNDNSMDGLVYTNIGDTYKSGFNMTGLLDRDYYSSKSFSAGGQSYPYIDATATSTANLFRFSGNDLTAVKVQKLMDFAATGYPIILGDNLITDSSRDAEDCTFQVTISGQGTGTASASLTAIPVLTDSSGRQQTVSPAYAWYKADGTAVSGSSSTLTLSGIFASASYYCMATVTYNGKTVTARSNTLTVAPGGTSYGATEGGWNDSGKYNGKNFDVNVTFGGERLTANISVTLSSDYSVSYAWYMYNQYYYNDTRVGSGSTLGLTAGMVGNTYYCVATIYKKNGSSVGSPAYSYDWTVTSQSANTSVTDQGGAAAVPFTTPAVAGAKSVNTAIVDSASQVYALLDGIKNKSNVMTESRAQMQQNSVYEYLNLSKPEIKFTPGGAPAKYDESRSDKGSLTPAGVDGKQVYSLTYTFQIVNATDATPQTTTYQAALYLDQDGDGNYAASENLADIRVTTSGSGGTLPVEPDELKAGTSTANAPVYTVTRQLPSGTVGILPWKLEVTKNGNGNQYIHTSQVDYAYIKPAAGQATTLNILQIDTTADKGGYNLEYSTSQTWGNTGGYVSSDGTHFNGIYGKLLDNVSSDFDVHIYTLYVDDLNTLYSNEALSQWMSYLNSRKSTQVDSRITNIYNYLNPKFNPGAYTDKTAALADLLNQFDMVIVGFGDCYSELNAGSAQAVVNYIGSGKSILFSHDTTSFYNLPISGYQTITSVGYYGNYNTGSTGSYWGYYFNTLLRSQVGLDRYGIVSSEPLPGGGTIRSALKSATSGSTLTSTQAGAIGAKGFTVAYQPGGTDGKTVPETQGFTNYELLRYSADSSQKGVNGMQSVSSDNRSTTRVSQVNKGKITTYPYNLNTADFGGSGGYVPISATHEQYYQLNMNSDDIVVWYCLADDSGSVGDCYANAPDDVTNNYYIYSVGNVTYTGAGHTSDASSVNGSESEAKLFVNTMIAAYRPQRTAPTLKVVDSASGAAAISTYYLTADYSGSGYTSSLVEDSADCPVYFVVTDTNLESDRQISLSLSYTNSAGAAVTCSETLPVHRASTSGKVYSANVNGTSGIVSGMVYYFNLPDSVLTDFGGRQSQSTMDLSLRVSTKFTEKNGTTSEKDSAAVPLTLQKIGLLNLG